MQVNIGIDKEQTGSTAILQFYTSTKCIGMQRHQHTCIKNKTSADM